MSRGKERKASSTCFFTSRDEGAVTYLHFINQDGLPDANPRGVMGDLWLKLEDVFSRRQKVLVLEHPSEMFGPRNMERFWEKVKNLSPEYQKCGWGWFPVSPQALAVQREENAFLRFVEAITQADTFVIWVSRGEVMLPFLGAALACDYRIVTDDTVFINHCLKGGFPAIGALAWFLVRHLGYGRALHLLMNREQINATEALQLALVDQVVSEADIEREIQTCVKRFAQIPGRGLITMKRLIAAAGDSLDTYLAAEVNIFERWMGDQRNEP